MVKAAAPTKMKWTPEAETAFSKVREALCTQLLLYMPNFNELFMVLTDASNCTTGAVLVQMEKGEECLLSYISRKLHPLKKNYATIEKDCLAIK